MIPVSERKAALEARLAEIKARLENIEEELDSHNDQDWEDLATERETDEVLEGIGLSGQAESSPCPASPYFAVRRSW